VSATSRDESDGVESDGVESDGVESDGVESDETEPDAEQYIDGQEEDSFPASDPHSDWSGLPERD